MGEVRKMPQVSRQIAAALGLHFQPEHAIFAIITEIDWRFAI